jgi:hypothetical protein
MRRYSGAPMANPPKKLPPKRKDLNHAWEAGDSIPAPEALHRDGESAWAMFNELSRQQEHKFAETAPMTMPPPQLTPDERSWASTQPAGAASDLAAAMPRKPRRDSQPLYTLDSAMLMARRNNRVCPRPERWNELSKLLPTRRTLRGSQQAPAAATGAAWAATPSLTKRLCFRGQIEWAEREGALETIMTFMQSMSEDEWLHMGED